MKHVVTGWDHVFGPWFAERTSGSYLPGRGSTIGLLDEGKGPVACCFYEGWNGASVLMHCAGEGKDWLNREFLWFSFYYPFEQLGAKVILSPVESTNTECVKFILHLGFSLEATFKDAAPKGDLLIFSMRKSDCKWLRLKDKTNGEAQRS